jgi:hypothetical protein
MGPSLSAAARNLANLARALTLPLLRAMAGILLTLIIPVLRAGAAMFLIIAAIALASDLGSITTAAPTRLNATSVVEHWRSISPVSLESTRAFLIKRTRPWVWDAFSTPLKLPAFIFFSVLGLTVGYFGRPRKRVNIFVN